MHERYSPTDCNAHPAGLWDVLYGPAFFYWGGQTPAPLPPDGAASPIATGLPRSPPGAPIAASPLRPAPVGVQLAANEASGTVAVRLLVDGALRTADPITDPTKVQGAGAAGQVPDAQRHPEGSNVEGGGTTAAVAGTPVGLAETFWGAAARAAEVQAAVVALTERAAASDGLEDNTAECTKVRGDH